MKTSTPYELRAELLNRAINIVETQYNLARQTAELYYSVAANAVKDIWDLNDPIFQDAKKTLDDTSKRYENMLDDALKLAVKMNEFVSSKP